MCIASTVELSTAIRPAGVQCALWNDKLYSELRKVLDVPADFLNEGWSFDAMQEGSGKGGTKMVFIGSRYIVKELSSEDHHTLVELAASYVPHVIGGESLLARILLHFTDPISGGYFLAMLNVVGSGPFRALFDLKGCADDRALEFDGVKIEPAHKRWWKLHLWCGRCAWNKARHAFHEGKLAAAEAEFMVSKNRREVIVQLLRRDIAWLRREGLMDYSLLVAVRLHPDEFDGASKGAKADNSEDEYATSVEEEDDGLLSLGIIDFLQRWTLPKQVARQIKACEPNKATEPPDIYADRFLKHFEERFICEPMGFAVADGIPLQSKFDLDDAYAGSKPIPVVVGAPSAICRSWASVVST